MTATHANQRGAADGLGFGFDMPDGGFVMRQIVYEPDNP
jgi:hypothetical protein